MQDWGKLIWCYGYSSQTQTLSSYRIALYEGGSLFGTRRSEMEKRLEEAIEKLKALDPNRHEPDITIQTRPDGRKVFFSLFGFGPGGAGYCAYTTLPGRAYDLLVMRIEDSEDDIPVDQKLGAPARPSRILTDIFARIEDEIIDAMDILSGKGTEE